MDSSFSVPDGSIALAVKYPHRHSAAGPWALGRGWAAAWKAALTPDMHFSASGQEAARPQPESRLCSQASLASHLFGTWNAISRKCHVIKSDRVPALVRKAQFNPQLNRPTFARRKSSSLCSKDPPGQRGEFPRGGGRDGTIGVSGLFLS